MQGTTMSAAGIAASGIAPADPTTWLSVWPSLSALEHPVTTELAVRSKPIIDMAAEFRTQEILL